MTSSAEYRANNALGVFVICLLMLGETVVAHHHRPSAASPYVWSALILVGAASLAYYLRFRLRRRATDRQAAARPGA